MVLLALVIVSFKVCGDNMENRFETKLFTDSYVRPRARKTFWTITSKGEVKRKLKERIHFLLGGQHHHVYRPWLHPMWRVRLFFFFLPNCKSFLHTNSWSSFIIIFRFVPTPAWCKFPPYKARLQRPYNPMYVKKKLVKAQIYDLHWYFRKNQNSMEQAMEAADKVWFPDPDWSLILILTEERGFS